MPIPLLIGAPVAFLASGAFWFLYSLFKDESFYIGPPGSGKTSLVNFLHKGELLEEYNPTNNANQIGCMYDLGGDETFVNNHWEKLIKNKKYAYLVYVFSVDDYLKNEITDLDNNRTYQKLVYLHLYTLKSINNLNKKIIVIGTHIDKLANKKEDLQKISKDLNNNINIDVTKLVFGSLANKDGAVTLKEDIEKALKSFDN